MDEAALGTTVTCTDDINKRSRDDCSDDASQYLKPLYTRCFRTKENICRHTCPDSTPYKRWAGLFACFVSWRITFHLPQNAIKYYFELLYLLMKLSKA